MKVVIGFTSALEYWLGNDLSACPTIEHKKDSMDIRTFIETTHISLPVHIMVEKASERRNRNSFVYHVLPQHLPKGSIRKITDNLYIASPELCFLQAAKKMTVAQLVLLACDLCAIYKMNEQAPYGQEPREPVTTVTKLKNYLSPLSNIDCLRKAKQAIRFALDHSNSPMESKLAAVGQLPLSRGGFALPKPKMNFNVSLSNKGRELLKRDSVCCDMVWPELKVVIEYDSTVSHMNEKQFLYDKRRSSALTLSGYTVIHVTKEHFKNIQTIEELMLLIRKTLGLQSRKERLEKYKKVREETIKEIFFTPRRRYL